MKSDLRIVKILVKNREDLARDLGVILDTFLTYDEYITSVVSKCIASLYQINRVKHILDKQSLITVIIALVFSRLYYCSSVWSNTL